MPNQLRCALKFVARFCEEKLTGDPTYIDGIANFDSYNLNLAVANSADMLRQIAVSGKAAEMCGLWNGASKWEEEIESLTFLREETGSALDSWRESVKSLRDYASTLADSDIVAAAEDRAFNERAEVEDVGANVAKNIECDDGPVAGFQWRYKGKVPPDTMQPKPWKLVSLLWNKRQNTASFDDLALPVYGMHGGEVTVDSVGSLRREANSFFYRHGIPLIVSVKQGTVRLEVSA